MNGQPPYGARDEEAHRVAYLIAGFIGHTLSEAEEHELDDWVNASDANMKLFEDLTDEKNIEANLQWMREVQSEKSYEQLQASEAFVIPKRRKKHTIWFAAASVALLAGVFLIYPKKSHYTASPTQATENTSQDIPAGGNRATLTLADGSVIDLATTANGKIQDGSGNQLSKPADGQLVYAGQEEAATVISYHTLNTPAGGQYQVTLQDGTRVWLNAGSILRYPSAFTGDEREVSLQGEAFFEVTKNPHRPFRVMLNDSAVVTVLGTTFNVMAYQNEAVKEVTLVDGRVSVSTKDRKNAELMPRMQAKIGNNSITTVNHANTEQVTGWKRGLFVFKDTPLKDIMRQVERWYNAEVIFKGEVPFRFNGTIQRSESLSKLLHLLELTGHVKFKIENRTVYVFP
jgi:ferric-dicitrate binding protein FerR (iron transport regulator)